MEFYLKDCVVLEGPNLEPYKCASFRVRGSRIVELDKTEPCSNLDTGACVIMPAMCNGHTHIGDCAWPDGATGMTLEEGFFRPDGYKYRSLASIDREVHRERIINYLNYMATCGTSIHIDFREQGVQGAKLLRKCSESTGVDSIILSQFDRPPQLPGELAENKAPLPSEALAELKEILQVADGFSESTMNDLSDPAWRRIRTTVKSQKRKCAIHCLEDESYRNTSYSQTGRGDLERAIDLLDPDLIIHLTVASDEEIQMLADSGITAVLNPRANASLGLPHPPIRKLMEAKVNLLLGTDNIMLNSPNLFAEMDYTYKMAKSQYGNAIDPNPREILKMVTSNAAPVIPDSYQGSLEEGGTASFVVLDFNASHLATTRNLHASIVSRVSPKEVLLTAKNGQALHKQENPYFS